MAKKILKRLSALLMVLAMLVSVFAFAEEVPQVADAPVEKAAAPADAAPAEEAAAPEAAEDEAAPAEDEAVEEEAAPEGGEVVEGEVVEGEAAPEDGETVEGEAAPEDGEAAEGEAAPEDGEAAPEDGEAAEGEAAPEDGEAAEGEADPAEDELVEGEESVEGEATEGEETIGYGYKASMTKNGIVLTKVETTCKHETTTFNSETLIVGYVSENNKLHKKVTQDVSYEECTSCHLYVSYTAEAPVGTLQAHIGLPHAGHQYVVSCLACGYECSHQFPEDGWTKDDSSVFTGAVELDDVNHQYYEYATWNATCMLCGTVGSDIRRGVAVGDAAAHVFDATYNGGNTCTECEYTRPTEEPACPGHPEGHLLETIDSWITYGHTYTPIDANTHSLNGYTVKVVKKCLHCGYVQNTYVSHSDALVRNHEFTPIAGGKQECVYCGYTTAICEHFNAYVVGEPTYTDKLSTVNPLRNNGDGTHTGNMIKKTTYKCPDCGETFTIDDEIIGTSACVYSNWVQDPETGYYVNQCICGAVECDHHLPAVTDTWTQPPYDTSEAGLKITANTNGTHTYSYYYKYEDKSCPLCGMTLVDPVVTKVEEPYTEPHEWSTVFPVTDTDDDEFHQDNSRLIVQCSICGVQKECAHTNTRESVYQYAGFRRKDEAEHYRFAEHNVYCADCGEFLYTDYTETIIEAHNWVDGKYCADCKAINCDHDQNSYEWYQGDLIDTTYEYTDDPSDDYKHTLVTTEEYEMICSNCGAVAGTKLVPITTTEDHDYWYGVCSLCDHQCSHAGRVDGTPYADYKVSQAGHAAATINPWTCTICDIDTFDYSGVGPVEPHDYDQTTHQCKECGWYCQHTGGAKVVTQDYYVPGLRDYDETIFDPESYHTHVYATVRSSVTGKCEDCGQVFAQNFVGDNMGLKPGTQNPSVTLPDYDAGYGSEIIDLSYGAWDWHTFDPKTGKCTVCGYECKHEGFGTQTSPEAFTQESVKSNGASGHTIYGVIGNQITCSWCGLGLKQLDNIKNVSRVEPHHFVNGVCTVCGYKSGSSNNGGNSGGNSSAGTTTSADAGPVFEGVDPSKYGLVLGTRMGVTLCNAVDGIGDAQISIWKLEELLGADNASALAQLPIKEQVLVVLSLLDYDDEAKDAIITLRVTLSDAATQQLTALEGQVNSDAKAEYFPDGTVTLQITADGATRLERYSFTKQDDGTWTYSGLAEAQV